jgi:hypothetical protein
LERKFAVFIVSIPLSTLAHSLTDTGQISTITGNLGIPLTGGLAAGFAIGVMKG